MNEWNKKLNRLNKFFCDLPQKQTLHPQVKKTLHPQVKNLYTSK